MGVGRLDLILILILILILMRQGTSKQGLRGGREQARPAGLVWRACPRDLRHRITHTSPSQHRLGIGIHRSDTPSQVYTAAGR